MFSFNEAQKSKGLEAAKGIADWICNVQRPWDETLPDAGHIPIVVAGNGYRVPAPSWNYGFASMGLASAYKTFKNEKYKNSMLRLGKVLSTFQIADPFHKEHYGAIREYSALCPWSYTRDATSGGWSFIELYRFTGEEEYLERAKIFGEWVLRKGLDEEGYPWFGVQLEEPFHQSDLGHIKNELQGNFQGGSLNFFYQLYKITEDQKWVDTMRKIADIFVDYVQQESGFFLSVYRDTKKPVGGDDDHAKLHRGNDDLGTLGLMCMYKLTGEEKYSNAVKKFLKAAWAAQREDGFFEESVAASAVILNSTFEAKKELDFEAVGQEQILKALEAVYSVQSDGERNPVSRGGLLENVSDKKHFIMRANCYALILFLKLFADRGEYLSV